MVLPCSVMQRRVLDHADENGLGPRIFVPFVVPVLELGVSMSLRMRARVAGILETLDQFRVAAIVRPRRNEGRECR